MRISITNLKGGSGKTTSAFFLAAGLARRGRTLVVDADPQGSALAWSEAAGGLPFHLIGLPVGDLHKRLPALSEGYEHLVIDTPPGHLEIVRSALLAVELAIVPLSPNMIEIDRMKSTLQLMSELEGLNEVEVRMLFTRVRAGTLSQRAAREFFNACGLPAFRTEIPLRERLGSAFGLAPHREEAYEDVLRELFEETPLLTVLEPAEEEGL